MRYRIVSKNSRYDNLEQKVEKLMDKGWKPQGGCFLDIDEDGERILCQAMVRGEPDKKERDWKVVRRVCSALVPEVGIREFEDALERLTKEGWKPDGDTLSMPIRTGNDPAFILLKPMYREKE